MAKLKRSATKERVAKCKKERNKLGSHNTPMHLAERVVARALEPHLLWMAQDPEGWDRAHRRPEPPPLKPHPLIPGCYCDPTGWAIRRRECPVHGIARAMEALASRERADAEERRRCDGPLLGMLELAVPMWIDRLRTVPADDRITEARGLAQVIASKGDVLQFGSKKKGEQAEVFNACAKGLAALAFQPGGVKFCGIHWDAHEHR